MNHNPEIHCEYSQIGEGFETGPDVKIYSENLVIGKNVSIAVENDDNFRHPGGVRIKAKSIRIGDDTTISRSVLIKGGNIVIGNNVKIREECTLDIREELRLGGNSYLNPHCRMLGRNVNIGTNFRMLTWAYIGGGSCFETQSRLQMGDNCHLGEFAQINTADKVVIGDEVGIGIQSNIFTHGAYQSILRGYPVNFGPVTIGSNCWLPHAYVLPNVEIGEGTVVAAGSVVNRNLPSFCLAGGIPAKVIRDGLYSEPPNLENQMRILNEFIERLEDILEDDFGSQVRGLADGVLVLGDGRKVVLRSNLEVSSPCLSDEPAQVIIALKTQGDLMKLCIKRQCTILALDSFEIYGNRDYLTSRIVDQFRRYGVRFKK